MFKNLINLSSSIIVSTAATIVAFAFSRFNFKYRNSLLFWFLSLLLTPPIVFTIPYYILMSNIGLRGTYVGLVIVYQTFAIPLT
ncbi:MAG: carbohydrate ABC transporter permease, partial [Nitrososphaerota archaeon]